MSKVTVTTGSLKFDAFANFFVAITMIVIVFSGDLHWAWNTLLILSIPYFFLESIDILKFVSTKESEAMK